MVATMWLMEPGGLLLKLQIRKIIGAWVKIQAPYFKKQQTGEQKMKIELSHPLPFIFTPGITSGYVEKINGSYVFTSGKFTQVLKQSEYDKLIDAATNIDKDNIEQKAEKKENAESRGRPGRKPKVT